MASQMYTFATPDASYRTNFIAVHPYPETILNQFHLQQPQLYHSIHSSSLLHAVPCLHQPPPEQPQQLQTSYPTKEGESMYQSSMFTGMSQEELQRYSLRSELAKGVSQFIKDGPDGNFRCGICGRDFVWQNSLVRHITCVHAGIKNFSCKRCGKAFKGRHGLKYHLEAKSCLKSKTTGDQQSSSDIDADFEDDAESDSKSSSPNPDLIKSESEPEKEELELLGNHEHSEVVNDLVSSSCFRTHGETVLKKRKSESSEERLPGKLAKRDSSSSISTTEDINKQHQPQNDQDQQQQHICPSCGKVFALYRVLNRHIKTVHESIDAFKCGLCPKAFKSKQGLQYHAQRAHPNAIDKSVSQRQSISIAIPLARSISQSSQSSFSSIFNNLASLSGGSGPQTSTSNNSQQPLQRQSDSTDTGIVPAAFSQLLTSQDSTKRALLETQQSLLELLSQNSISASTSSPFLLESSGCMSKTLTSSPELTINKQQLFSGFQPTAAKSVNDLLNSRGSFLLYPMIKGQISRDTSMPQRLSPTPLNNVLTGKTSLDGQAQLLWAALNSQEQ